MSTFNPFPGLRPFQQSEKYLFFGREKQVVELITRLRKTRFMAVVGVSGSGKSSLVKAGVLPELHGGTMAAAGSSWEVAVMRPGGDPLGNLASCLINADLHDPEEEDIHSHVRATLSRSGMGLLDTIEQSDLEEDSNLLLVVDQFEEIFRFRQQSRVSNEEAGHFITLLLEASQQMRRRIYVVLTMRSDFLGDCAQFRDLAEAVNEGEYLIPRLNRTQRKEAIVGPVKVGGSDISNRLLQRLLNDIGDDPDQLPILQHALMRTWEQWEAFGAEGPLDLEHYRATGGMSEALSRHADEVYAELQTDSAKWTASKIFKALTERADQDRGIRRPMRFGELCEITEKKASEVTAAIDPFRIAGRTFLMPGPETDLKADTIVDISHESLMRVWTRLKSWVDDEAQSAKIYRRLADTASLRKDGRAGLYRDPDLQIALSWRSESKPNKAWADHYFPGFEEAMGFLDESHSEAEKEAKEKEAARKRELEQAQALALAEQEKAEAERKRAEEKEKSANRMKLLSFALAFAGVLAICFLVFALIAKDEVESKVLELADRSAASAEDLLREGKKLEALAWMNDAWSLANKSEKKQNTLVAAMSETLQEIPIVTGVSLLSEGVVRAGFDQDGGEFYTINRLKNSFIIKIYEARSKVLVEEFQLPIAPGNLRKIVQVGDLLLFHIGERNLCIYSLAKNELLQRQITLSGWVWAEHAEILEKSNLLVLPIVNTQSVPKMRGQLVFLDIETGQITDSSIIFNDTFKSATEVLGPIAIDQENESIYFGTTFEGWNAIVESQKGNLYQYNTKNKSVKLIENPKANHLINYLNFDPESNLLIVSDEPRKMWPTSTESPASVTVSSINGSRTQTFELESRPLHIEAIQGGSRILIHTFDGSVTLWEIGENAPIWKEVLDSKINSMRISPNEEAVLFATDSGNIIGREISGAMRNFYAVLPDRAIVADFLGNAHRFIGINSKGLLKEFEIQRRDLKRISPKTLSNSRASFSTNVESLGNYILTANNNVGYTLDGLAIDFQEDAEDEFVEFSFDKEAVPNYFQVWPWSYPAGRTDRFSKKALFEVFNHQNEIVESSVIDFGVSKLSSFDCDPSEISTVKISNLTENFARLGFSEIAFLKEDPDSFRNVLKNPDDVDSFIKVNAGYEVNADGRLSIVKGPDLISSWATVSIGGQEDFSYDNEAEVAKIAKSTFYHRDYTGFLAISSYLDESVFDDEMRQMTKIALSDGSNKPASVKLVQELIGYLKNKNEYDISPDFISNLSNDLLKSEGKIDLIFKYGVVPQFFDNELIHSIPDFKIEELQFASLDFPRNVSFSRGLTLECWIKHGNNGAIINKGGGYNDDGFSLMLNSGNYRFELQNTETKEKGMLDVPLTNGRVWTHVALTWDAYTKEMSIYLNGQKKPQTTIFDGPIGINNDIPLLLGGMATRSDRKSLNSNFSELRIWSVSRSEEEIKNTYEKRKTESHPDLIFRRSFSTLPSDLKTAEAFDFYSNTDWRLTDELPFGPTTTIALGNSAVTVAQSVYSLIAFGGLELRKGNHEKAIDLLERARSGGVNTYKANISPELLEGLQNNDISRFLLGLSYLRANRLSDADKLISANFLNSSRWSNSASSSGLIDWQKLIFYMSRELRNEYIQTRSRK